MILGCNVGIKLSKKGLDFPKGIIKILIKKGVIELDDPINFGKVGNHLYKMAL